MRPVHALAALALILPVPALAQQQLPTTSRAEQTVQGLNQSMDNQSQLRSAQQQNQFETNQLRTDIQRSQAVPRPNARGVLR